MAALSVQTDGIPKGAMVGKCADLPSAIVSGQRMRRWSGAAMACLAGLTFQSVKRAVSYEKKSFSTNETGIPPGKPTEKALSRI